MLALLFQTLGITAPVFSMLFIGVLLRRVGWIDQGFIQTASALVFNATMPVMLFLGIYHSDLHRAASPAVLTFFCLATLGGFLLAWAWAHWRVPRQERGVYVQGAFRGNNGIVGLALATSLYGEHGLALGSVLAALVILCYNTLATVVLAIYSPVLKSDPLSIARQVLVNPLIIGVLAAFPFAWWGIQLPAWVLTSGDYFVAGPVRFQTRKVISAIAATSGTNQPEIRSAIAWIGARLRCASATIRTIRARTVSAPIARASIKRLPVPFMVPPVSA